MKQSRAQPESLVWLAPWFGGLASRYLEMLERKFDLDTLLVTTSAGLTAVRRYGATDEIDPRLLSVRAWLGFLRILVKRHHRYDVALLDDTWDPRFGLLWLLGRRRILLVHDAEPHDASNRHRWDWQARAKSLFRGRARYVVCFSEYVRSEIAASDEFRRVVATWVLPLIPEVANDGVAPIARRPTLVVAGRFSPYKNTAGVVDAWRVTSKQFPGVTLLLAGSGVSQEVAKLNPDVGPAIEICDGTLSERDLQEIIASALAIVVCYRKASQSGLASLALDLGTPVITSSAGGLSEYQPSPELTADSTRELIAAFGLVILENARLREAARAFARRVFAPDAVALAFAEAIGIT